MQIYTHLIEKYCANHKSPISVSINTSSEEHELIFTRGEYWQNGGLEVSLTHQEIDDILLLNGVTGEGGIIRNLTDQDLIDKHIYDLLAKYILQMFTAAMAILVYDDIRPLPHHKDLYFRNTSQHLVE